MSNTTKTPTPGERVEGFGGDIARATVAVGKAFRDVPDLYAIVKQAELAEIERAARAIHSLKCEVAALWAILDEHSQLLGAEMQAKRDQYNPNRNP